ncbi:ABC transporter ATP-binding protein [Candidatus Phytoplasma pini]|uniref:Multidrug efflux pump, ATP-binding and permease protein n=1 Tax=Candidatus Phytoplasma pini TaxID=267362 RepID=A0A559KJY1_9MOLU|nr:ABC transporter ATP-binding protein [Candidatus Phytoplasma pini]TVY12417.1 Multidrug efflux pump, ATP-binding and permease protein [Candidatus Phytoplasma pini]
MIRLFFYLKPFKKKIINSIILILLLNIVSLSIPLYEGKYIFNFIKEHLDNNKIDTEKTEKFIKMIYLSLFINFLLYFIATLGKFIYNRLLIPSIHKGIKNLREDLYKKINKLTIKYFDQNTVGNIISTMTIDVEILSNGLQQTFASLISSFFSINFLVFLMFYLNWRLGIIISLMIPLSLMTIFIINKKSRNIFIQRFEINGEYNGFLQEKLTGQKEIILYNQQQNVIKDFKKINQKLSQTIFKSNFSSGLASPITNSFTYIILTVMFVLGYFLLQSQDEINKVTILYKLGFVAIKIGTFQAFIQYIWRLGNPINELSQSFVVLQSAKAASQRIFIFLYETDEKENPEPLILEKTQGNVVFKDVCFGYRKDHLILKDMNLFVAKNQMVAIVGPTGSGKTTLINLLTRFYDVNSGNITIDGIDIRNLKRSNLRQIVGMVSQDVWLFPGTILDNIRYGNDQITDEKIIEIAKKTKIHDFIMEKKDGYKTVLSEETDNLSQGEKQLITIVRVILRNPKILILDEATSTIDTRMEMIFQESIQKLIKQKTSFIIAHRLSTIVNADIIIFLRNGCILEQGKHYELLQKKGFYYELYQSQFAK